MKKRNRTRLAALLLCLLLALALTACGRVDPPPRDPTNDPDISPAVTQEEAAASLELLRSSIAADGVGQCAGAVAYLGCRSENETSDIRAWLQATRADLVEIMPFLLTIPDECVIGDGQGEIFCFVPRGENDSVAINRILAVPDGNGILPEVDAVLYRSEAAQPLLVCAPLLSPDADGPYLELEATPEAGEFVSWYFLINDQGTLSMPMGDYGCPSLLDFGLFAYFGVEGLQAGDDDYLPPTDLGLQGTSWSCDGWDLTFNADLTLELRCQNAPAEPYTTLYTGSWIMDGQYLRITAVTTQGIHMADAFPILISPSGENLYIQQSDSGECPLFLGEDMYALTMTLCVG